MQSDLQSMFLYNLPIMVPLRVLLIEDVDAEVQQILRELLSGGYHVDSHCVKTRAALYAALFHRAWDIVFCDDSVPSLSPIEVLATLRESGQRLPFFLRAGISGEDTMVTIIHPVADDFIVKENLVMLLPGLAQELQELQTPRSRQ